MKKFICFLFVTILLFTSACNKGSDESSGSPTVYTKSDEILSVKGVGYISGRMMEGYDETWAVRGTDLGHPIYDSQKDILYFAHGDTFNDEDVAPPVLWRSNVISYKENASEWNPVENPYIDGYLSNNSYGMATSIIEGKHANDQADFEVTKIPRGGVVLNGVIYMWYMSVGSWSPWVNNYSGVVKSTDNGQTWERIYDLTWVRSATERYDTAHKLATQTVDGADSGITLDFNKRVAPNFMQMYPVDGKDGYVYFFGITEGIHCSSKLARVKYENIEDFEKYEYFYVLDENDQPVWKSGSEGLAAIKDGNNGIVIKNDGKDVYTSMGESSIFWNNYLNKWVMIYHLKNAHIVYRTSDKLWAGWSEAKTILDRDDYPFPEGAERTYGGFSHEVMARDGGKKIYIVVSTWVPYNCYMLEVEFK